jgi:hypothetical protein
MDTPLYGSDTQTGLTKLVQTRLPRELRDLILGSRDDKETRLQATNRTLSPDKERQQHLCRPAAPLGQHT